MTAVAPSVDLPRGRSARARLAPLATLATRRFQLVARTPRELLVPLLTPIMFALVIAPALMEALHTGTSYESFVAIGRNSPRISAGASGFRSHRSRCDGPPGR